MQVKIKYAQCKPVENNIDIASLITSCWDMHDVKLL